MSAPQSHTVTRPPRVKKSCAPCRLRKTRCDDKQPCASCVLRGTQSECHLSPHASHRPSSDRADTSSRETTTSPWYDRTEKNTQGSLDRYRMTGLRDNLHSSSVQPSDKATHSNWAQIKAVLPTLDVLEILLEFLTQECSWLYYRPNITSCWLQAITTRAVDPSQAGSLCMSIAVSALLLGTDKQLYYQPNCLPSVLHVQFFQLGQSFANVNPVTMDIDDVQLLLDIYWYSVFAGNVENIARWINLAAAGSIRLGLLDEADESWDALNGDQREERRRAAESVLGAARWMLLGTGIDLLAGVRLNVCSARPMKAGLESPIILNQPGSLEPRTDHRLRILRLHSRAEHQRSISYNALMFEMTSYMPRLHACSLLNMSGDPSSQADKCEAIYHEMLSWRDERVIAAGFPVPASQLINSSDAFECQGLAQSLCLHTAFFTIVGIALRPWLALSEMPLFQSQARLQLACLQTALGILDSIPFIETLVASRLTPVVTPWLASNFFNAAITFAIPILRAVKRYTALSHDDEIQQLPWSLTKANDISRTVLSTPQISALGAHRQLPAEIFGDESVRLCAQNMLALLDALTKLNDTPLGRGAAVRLGELIEKMGLRRRETPIAAAPGHVLQPQAFAASDLPQEIDWQSKLPDADMPLGNDNDISNDTFEQMLEMDPSIWDGFFRSLGT